ncbi:putative Uncharacterized membrane protein YkvI [[Clostridium] ultunense Esp]|uniref:Putative Uncharacterized membrane protein YkvI n=1 Tax=[Clostridium] ultunense Esp TaxID=1288971 RepID=M1ZII9_9FIRM|nr:hypothetical protein [Schnuerera ultunensis]CCQ98243.1 putative Uncharacterized membrane protein YkvI [[Clostridium] ultunense Esp]SHD75990.1 putative Uncharacterized membrane protein YkvI [[Clostridium] ultunense Esp]
MKNWVKITSIYVGTVIGAGFASGREIIEFFGIYGLKGIWGMLISGLLFSLVGSLFLIKVYNNKIRGFDELITNLFGKKFGFLLDTIMIFSLYTGFSVMIAGSGAIFKDELGLSYNIGILVMVFFAFIVFLFSLKGISFINSILVPLLIIGIVFTSIYVNIREGCNFSNIEGAAITSKGNFITSSFLYFGSNSLIIIIVFSSLYPLINNKKTAIQSGITGGIILSVLGISILTSTLIYYNEVSNLDIPMLRICNYIGKNYRKLYAIILWIAMFTTALANGFGFMNRISKERYKIPITALFCITAIPLAKVGFANLVGIIYPIFGVIGFAMMVGVLVRV